MKFRLCSLLACSVVWSTHALVAPSAYYPLSTIPSVATQQEVEILAQDVETVMKKLRPSESDPYITGSCVAKLSGSFVIMRLDHSHSPHHRHSTNMIFQRSFQCTQIELLQHL
jgi:hypothetical protein